MTHPFAWIRKIAAEIPELDAIPLFGKSPPFDWKHLSSQMTTHFGIKPVEISPRGQNWLEADDLKKGMGSHLSIQPIAVTPIGTVFWMMSHEEIGKLTSWMLKGQVRSRAPSSEILQEGFYRYLCLNILDECRKNEPIKNVGLQLSDEERLPYETCFCIDIELKFGEKSCWGRLAVPPEFRTAWVHHFESYTDDYTPSEMSRALPLIVGVKAGSLSLDQAEWETLQPGDFVVLEKPSYNPKEEAGVATLMLGPTPLFNLKLQKNQIELLDYAFIQEETMTKEPTKEPKREEDQEEESVALREIPLNVTVEIARFKMTLDKLMQLNPGNTLELPLHPEQSVSLVVNGQQVGKAELVHLGEVLGLRILEIG